MTNFKNYYSYNDILLKPKLSIVESRKEISLNTRITKKNFLKIPLIAANMDTVTEDSMAIELAKRGGIGIIHRYCSIENQVNMIKKVKRCINYYISDPICLNENLTVKNYLDNIENTGIKTVIIVDNNKKFVGIVNKYNITTLEAINNTQDYENLRLGDIMSKASYYKTLIYDEYLSIEKNIENLINKMRDYNVNYLPVVSDQISNKIVGLITLKDLLFYANQKNNANIDKEGNLCVGAAIGVNGDYIERANELMKANCDILVIDIAHGHSVLVPPVIRTIKNINPDIQIIAGNVATKEGVKYLAEAGADAIKVNIGAGSICTTRIMTGCGVPQFSAVLECSQEAKKYNIPIIADGGHSGQIGNMVKALAAGASCCMLGKTFAGTTQSPGQVLVRDGKKVKVIRGMAGYISNINKRRKIDNKDINSFTPEGVEGYIDYRGDVNDIIDQITGGIRSGLSYCGVKDINGLHNSEIEFCLISDSGKKESNHHGIKLI